MNTQELQMILDALRQISGDAAGAAQWWIVAHYGVSYLKAILWFMGLGGVALIVAHTVRCIVQGQLSRVQAEHGGKQWAQFGMKVARSLGGMGSLNSFERDEAMITEALMAAVQREAEKGKE